MKNERITEESAHRVLTRLQEHAGEHDETTTRRELRDKQKEARWLRKRMENQHWSIRWRKRETAAQCYENTFAQLGSNGHKTPTRKESHPKRKNLWSVNTHTQMRIMSSKQTVTPENPQRQNWKNLRLEMQPRITEGVMELNKTNMSTMMQQTVIRTNIIKIQWKTNERNCGAHVAEIQSKHSNCPNATRTKTTNT